GYQASLFWCLFTYYDIFILYFSMEFIVMFFFFQAEDGIRDDLVTGVQTCALPIYLWIEKRARPPTQQTNGFLARHTATKRPVFRSEERRVGKECRSRWSPYH